MKTYIVCVRWESGRETRYQAKAHLNEALEQARRVRTTLNQHLYEPENVIISVLEIDPHERAVAYA